MKDQVEEEVVVRFEESVAREEEEVGLIVPLLSVTSVTNWDTFSLNVHNGRRKLTMLS